MDSRRAFIKKAALLAGSSGIWSALPASIQRAIAIDPEVGTTFYDAEHVVLLMQENRSFDHCYGTLQGVRGFNDPRAIQLPNGNPVWLQTNGNGHTYAPFRLNIRDTKATWMRDLPHSWENQVDARNSGRYDKWLDAKRSGNKEYQDMPLTMGYYNREDIPFYYALADAFTVCDQHFCSSLTGTTANRMFFWSGKLRDNPKAQANVRNSEVGYSKEVSWKTFPERLEEQGISWKVYQNELSIKTELSGEDEALLGNFTDNNLEWFSQYHVRFSPSHYQYLRQAVKSLPVEIDQLTDQLKAEKNENERSKIERELTQKQRLLNEVNESLVRWHPDNFDKLSDVEKNLHRKAFTTNAGDPNFHQTETITYEENGEQRSVKVPKGDILHQFRQDVQNGQLPTVSWLVAPQRFSDHPSSPWYGAWYVSEVLDILTKNPEVWKKTIFILTYDENDGYFDHVPPFVTPNPADANTGRVSNGLDSAEEFVTLEEELQKEGMNPRNARQSPVGLGYRVPMVVASPWSRGGWVNSEVCDITSTLMFLEKFLSHKTGKPIQETNISSWRRAICGDMTSIFRPYHGEKIKLPKSVDRNEWMQAIHSSQFRETPQFHRVPHTDNATVPLPQQEQGIRDSNALPYELYVDEQWVSDRSALELTFMANDNVFGQSTAGAPFSVYAFGDYLQRNNDGEQVYEPVKVWDFAVVPQNNVRHQWPLAHFKKGTYCLLVYGPNGFFREFSGGSENPDVVIRCGYERNHEGKDRPLSGNVVLNILNKKALAISVLVADHAYGMEPLVETVDGKSEKTVVINTQKSYGWYDVGLYIDGWATFARRYAGRVETGEHRKTDPCMGRVV